MPRPNNMGVQAKPKDFKKTIVRLFNSLDRYRKVLLICMLLSLFSALLSTIAPSKLSGITDIITEGIKPNTKKIEQIMTTIYGNVIKNQDRDASSVEPEKVMSTFQDMNADEKKKYLEEFTIDGVKISIDEQIALLNTMDTVDSNEVNSLLKSDIPKSVDSLISSKMDTDLLNKRVAVLAIIYILSSIFSYIQGLLMANVSNNYAKRLRSDISEKINRLPLKYFDTHETGDVLSRVTNDIDSIGMNINSSLSSLVSNVTLFTGSIIMMFVTNWIMAITAIAASVIGFSMSFILLKESQKYFTARQKELGNLNAHIEEIYSGHNVVKTYNAEASALDEFDRINGKLYTNNRKSQFLSGIMQPIMGFVGNLGYVAVCIVGSILVMKDMTNFGAIIAFMIYVRLFTNPLSQIAQAATGLQSTAASAERVFEFIDESELSSEDNIDEYLAPSSVQGNIDFKNVNFGYDKDKLIIKNFTASIKKGQKVAIVGPTGAGKTTIVNLLMKFYEINSGDILIDNVSINDLTRENIHNLFVMVLQDTWLFEGSIKDNIKFNKDNISEEKILNSCKVVGVDHFIKTLPAKLDTIISDTDSISQGQKQLLTIARGMIENAPFLILDEATSNVDTRTEELVQKAMDKLSYGKTCFIIAHRLSTIKNADLILVMKDGNIIEQGTHDDLMKENGFYSKLYNSQFEL